MKVYEYEDVRVMQDGQDVRSQIYLNYVTKGPKTLVVNFIVVCTIYMFLKSKIKNNKT